MKNNPCEGCKFIANCNQENCIRRLSEVIVSLEAELAQANQKLNAIRSMLKEDVAKSDRNTTKETTEKHETRGIRVGDKVIIQFERELQTGIVKEICAMPGREPTVMVETRSAYVFMPASRVKRQN